MAGWYHNETISFLGRGKFELEIKDPDNHPSDFDPEWYQHMLDDLYDIFTYQDDIYQKFKEEFGLVRAFDPRGLSSYHAAYRC